MLCLSLQVVNSNPVAVVCPVGQATDNLMVNADGTFQVVEITEIGSAAYIWTNYTSGQPFISCGTPGTILPLQGQCRIEFVPQQTA